MNWMRVVGVIWVIITWAFIVLVVLSGRPKKPHVHTDGFYDNYWIACRGCGARRAPGNKEWREG
jgi:hypothetical protein